MRISHSKAKLILIKSLEALWSSLRDLLPIIATIAIFQIFVFQQGLDNFSAVIAGLVMVVIGLSMFIAGLQLGLFPLGEQMAREFAIKGSIFWLMMFAFGLGFGTTFAEPALIAVSQKAAQLASEEAFPKILAGGAEEQARAGQAKAFVDRYALVLRFVVAISVGLALVLGVIRIVKGWPIHYLIISGYALVILMTPFAPSRIIGVAYDAGGVTTSTITVPLTAALGVGLASSIKGRNALVDGFGLIAFASLLPIIFVLILGAVW